MTTPEDKMTKSGGYQEEQFTNYDPLGLAISKIGGDNPYLYNGKELYSDFSDAYEGVYDFGARYYNPLYGRWFAPDPEKQHPNPYIYCGNNPVMKIDPDGRWYGFFITQFGIYLGWDGIDDKKMYILKNTTSEFKLINKNEVKGKGITDEEKDKAISFVKENSGDTQAFINNPSIYDNFIEVSGDYGNWQSMLSGIKDNGLGGTFPRNNREYGGYIDNNGNVVHLPPGPVVDPLTAKAATFETPGGVSSFHSHPSGTNTAYSVSGAQLKTNIFEQSPSDADIKSSEAYVHYVFGMRDRQTYIYNSEGIQAVMPTSVIMRTLKKINNLNH